MRDELTNNRPVLSERRGNAAAFLNLDRELVPIHDLNYGQIMGDARVLFFAENHSNNPIRTHLVQYANTLKNLGITQFLVEAPPDKTGKIAKLNAREATDLVGVDCGPGQNSHEAVMAFARVGVEVVPFDIDQNQNSSTEEREGHMFEIVRQILASDPQAKLAILIGAFHTVDTDSLSPGVPSLRRRCGGLDCELRVLQMVGGSDEVPKSVTASARISGLADSLFVVNMKDLPAASKLFGGKEHADYFIHLPQQPNSLTESGFPRWCDF